MQRYELLSYRLENLSGVVSKSLMRRMRDIEHELSRLERDLSKELDRAGGEYFSKYPEPFGSLTVPSVYSAEPGAIVGEQMLWRLVASPFFPDAVIPDGFAATGVLFEVTVYLDIYTSGQLDNVDSAVRDLAADAGIERLEVVEEVRGSIFRRLVGKLKEGATSDTVRTHLAEIDQALSLQLVGAKQAEVDTALTENAVSVIGSLVHVPNACVRVGSLLVVKHTPQGGEAVLLVRNLSPIEIQAIVQNPGIQRNPEQALELLSTAVYAIQAGQAGEPPT